MVHAKHEKECPVSKGNSVDCSICNAIRTAKTNTLLELAKMHPTDMLLMIEAASEGAEYTPQYTRTGRPRRLKVVSGA